MATPDEPAPSTPKLSRKQRRDKRPRDSVGSTNIATTKRPRSGAVPKDKADEGEPMLEQAFPFRGADDNDISDLQTAASSSGPSARPKKPRKAPPVSDPESWLKKRGFIKE